MKVLDALTQSGAHADDDDSMGFDFGVVLGFFPVLLLQTYPEKERLAALGKEVSLQFATGAVHSITLPLKPQGHGSSSPACSHQGWGPTP